jgi:hypothetical protein
MKGIGVGLNQGSGRGGAASRARDCRDGIAPGGGYDENKRVASNPVGLLMAQSGGGGKQGGLVERPTRPKPPGAAAVASLLHQRAILGVDRAAATDGNWDDGEAVEEPGFRQGRRRRLAALLTWRTVCTSNSMRKKR